MRTKEFVRDVSRRMSAYQKDVSELLLQHFRSALLSAVRQGEKVHMAKVGTFYPARKRKSGNMTVKFKPSISFLRDLNNSENLPENLKEGEK